MGGGEKFQVPDWRSYKTAGIPELENLERMLAARGLKDPWIRNEVWRFQPEHKTSILTGIGKSVFRGFKWAAGAMVITILAEKFIFKKGDGHGDHH